MIDFKLTDEQAQMVSAILPALMRTPIAADPGLAPLDNVSESVVARLGALGWIGVAAPEIGGGSASSMVEEALIAHEYGRWLITPDMLATAVAGTLALHSGDAVGARRFNEGSDAAAFGIPIESDIERSDDDYIVVQGSEVSHYVLLNENAPTVAKVNSPIELRPCVDPALRIAVVGRTNISITWEPDRSAEGIGCRILALVAAMQAGVAEACLHLATDYAKTRKQFGRLIGSFQAIKHHCADMHVRARLAGSQAMHAAMLLATQSPSGVVQAIAAFEVACAAAVKNAEVGIQIHGAMGFSAECTAHRFLKRAHVLRIIGRSALPMQPSLTTLLRRQS